MNSRYMMTSHTTLLQLNVGISFEKRNLKNTTGPFFCGELQVTRKYRCSPPFSRTKRTCCYSPSTGFCLLLMTDIHLGIASAITRTTLPMMTAVRIRLMNPWNCVFAMKIIGKNIFTIFIHPATRVVIVINERGSIVIQAYRALPRLMMYDVPTVSAIAASN